jgi:diguanylate cyclase (GGDEF)-like protein
MRGAKPAAVREDGDALARAAAFVHTSPAPVLETLTAKKRDDLIDAVVDALRARIEPRRMMLAVANALAAATGSDVVTIRACGTDMSISAGERTLGLAHVLEASTSFQGEANGSLRLARDVAKGAFGEAERSLIDAVLPHLSVAFALIQSLEASNKTRLDSLTGLLNRRAFLCDAARKHAAAARAGRDVTLIVFDVDDLEDSNCGPGRSTRDEALAAIGRALGVRCGDDDVAGVLDEDEFAIVTDATTSSSDVGEGIRSELAQAARPHCTGVSISAGCVVGMAGAEDTIEDLIRRAECALHEAKREGRNCVAVAEHALR